MDKQQFVTSLEHAWKTGKRWSGVTRPYAAGDVYRLRGSIDIEYSLGRYGAARLWQLFQDDAYVAVLSAITGKDRKSTRLNSSHLVISYAVFCLKKKKNDSPGQPSAASIRCDAHWT